MDKARAYKYLNIICLLIKFSLSRLEWSHKINEFKIVDLVKSLSKMRTRKGVVLYTKFTDPLGSVHASLLLPKSMNVRPDFFLKFVAGLPRLATLCLFCFKLDTLDVEEISKKNYETDPPFKTIFLVQYTRRSLISAIPLKSTDMEFLNSVILVFARAFFNYSLSRLHFRTSMLCRNCAAYSGLPDSISMIIQKL